MHESATRHYILYMNAIVGMDHLVGKMSWRKAFKAEWKRLLSCPVDPASLEKHITDPVKFVCACDYFLLSRLLYASTSCIAFSPSPTGRFL